MSAILELREKRAAAWDRAKSFLDTCRDENGLVSPENAAIYDRMENEIVEQGKAIERLERQTSIDSEMNAPTSVPITNAPQRPAEVKVGRASDEYRRDFAAALRGRPVSNLLQEQVDADGGYTVPQEFERKLVVALEENNVIRQLAKRITTAAERKIPIAATPSVATWVGEVQPIPESTMTFGQTFLDAYKVTDLIKISTELLQDSLFDLEDYIIAEFSRAFGSAEEEAFISGTGVGQPTGIFTASGGQVGVTAASATAISFDDLIHLVYSLKSPYRKNAVFLTNDATVGSLRKLKDANNQYLWQVSVQQGEPDRILGYKLFTSPFVPVVATGAFSVAFGDFANYWIADRAGRTVQRLNELYAGHGLIGYLATQRVDAKVILAEGIKLLQQA